MTGSSRGRRAEKPVKSAQLPGATPRPAPRAGAVGRAVAVTPRQRGEISAGQVCAAGRPPLPCASFFRGLADFSAAGRRMPPPRARRRPLVRFGRDSSDTCTAMEGRWPRLDSGALRAVTSDAAPDLAGLREQVDAVDRAILEKLNERARLVQSIGRVKAATRAARNTSPRASDRSSSSWSRATRAPSRARASRRSSARSSPPRARSSGCCASGYFGPEGTFTHQAARQNFGQLAELASLGSIAEVFAAVERGSIDLGVVPVENTTEGVVTQTFDALAEHDLSDLRRGGPAHLAAAALAQRAARRRAARGVAPAAARAVPALARSPPARRWSGSRRPAPPSRRGSRPRTPAWRRSGARSRARSTACARSSPRSRIAATTPPASS